LWLSYRKEDDRPFGHGKNGGKNHRDISPTHLNIESYKANIVDSKVYLDTCVWCRPFDRPTPRIIRERRAVHKILSLADEGKIEIVSSGVALFETSMIDDSEKRSAVFDLIYKSTTIFAEITEKVKKLAVELADRCDLGNMDAAHIATAIDSNAQIFLTTDDEILEKTECISKFGIIVKNPVLY
jgi:predicted nucleic acid-binding protein